VKFKNVIALILLLCTVNTIFLVPVKASNNSIQAFQTQGTKDFKDLSSSVLEIIFEEILETSINIPDTIERKFADFDSAKKRFKSLSFSLFFLHHDSLSEVFGITLSDFNSGNFKPCSVLSVVKGYGYIFRLTPF
jgi:hypothetical protein